ncbi:MAG: transporter substrate-binding domain-containing protein [Desulfobacterales bacterium]|nr:transporter substrate-binding domain-containing protein [Desulfobacterales bacterium]MCP4163973.1 transporter substrate-binding domain-containing protein [Deltaproteobacteria bacterium]
MRISVFILAVLLFLSQYSLAETKETINFACAEWKPILFIEDAEIKGLYAEFLEEIFGKNMNMKIKYSFLPWKRAQKSVEKGDADFTLTVPTKKRLTYSIKNEKPIYQMYLHIYTYKNHEKIDQIREIKSAKDILNIGLIPVTNLGNGWHKQNIDSLGIDTYYVTKEDDIVKFLASKRGDIMIEAVIPMNYKIKQYGLVSKIELTNARFGPLNFNILLSKKSKYVYLMPEINSVVNRLIKDGTMGKLTSKYMKLE